MKFHYLQIYEMLQTLQEATAALLSQTDASIISELTSGIQEFVGVITEHIEGAAGESAYAVSLLNELYALLESEPMNASLLKEHVSRTIIAANRLIVTTNLKVETSFSDYIDLLIGASEQGFCILITSSDTPCGSTGFTPEIGARLCLTGIRTNLSDKWRVSFCAVIDGGRLIEEKISDTHSTTIKCRLGKSDVSIKSAGFGKADAMRSCSIMIDGKQTAVGGIGLSIVVFDKDSSTVLDSVGFNTYAQEIDCIRPGDSEIVREFKRNNPGVTFIVPHYPAFPEKDLSENEKWIMKSGIHHTIIKQNPELPSAIREYIKESDGIVEVLTVPASYIGTDGSRYFEDHSGKYVNTRNGHRVTIGQPENPKRTIFIMGGCKTLGIGVRDEGTLASQLQKVLNKNSKEEGFIVENYAFTLNGTSEYKQMESILTALPVKSGDIVVGFGEGIFAYNPKLNERPLKYGELFFDDAHSTETAYRLTAEGIYELLEKNDYFRDTLCKEQSVQKKTSGSYGLSAGQLAQLGAYKQRLSALVKSEFGDSDNVGAIVMNCNPFTLGHRYLVEECAKRVEHLIIFVVSEDKSFFPFDDRIELVRKGVGDLSNVRVIESGNFIISTLTFKEYFNKSEIQDKIIDSSNDVTLFANELAPAAGIKVRFVGSEPLDKVTNQYNKTLARILPKYGIAFEEITRKETGGSVISASRVRELLEAKDWEAIRALVPDTTYEYLKNRF